MLRPGRRLRRSHGDHQYANADLHLPADRFRGEPAGRGQRSARYCRGPGQQRGDPLRGVSRAGDRAGPSGRAGDFVSPAYFSRYSLFCCTFPCNNGVIAGYRSNRIWKEQPMSQELIGACGSAVGTSDYFQRINQGTIFAPFMPSQDGYQYSSALGQLCSRCAAVIDEIYSDLQGVASSIQKLSQEYRDNLTKLISNLEEAASFLAPAYTSTSGRLSLLARSESSEENSIFGIGGLDIGSLSYMQSKCCGIFSSAFADLLSSITQTLVSDLLGVAEQIATDIETGVSLHHYIRDENGEAQMLQYRS